MSIARRVFLMPRPVVSTIAAAAAAAVLGGALPAHALSFQFNGDAFRSNSNRALAPSIKVSLDAMANPRGIEQMLSTDEAGRPVITAQNASNSMFSLYVSLKDTTSGESLRILPPGPCRKAECMERGFINFIGLAADGTPLLVQAVISSPDGRLDPSSIFAFNPQPEPPGDFGAGVIRVDFRLLTESASPDVSVTLNVVGGATPITLD